MVNADFQRNQFQGRLKRIKKGGPNTMGTIYVGPIDEDGTTEDKPHFGVLSTIVAFGLGLISYLTGNLAQFHLAGDLERLGPQALMVAETAGDLIVAAMVLYILFKLTRMRGFGPALVGALGLFVMMGSQSVAIRMAPELFSSLYSDTYVSQYTSDTGAVTSF